MKLRPLLLIVLLLGGFYVITTQMAPTGVLAGWVQQNVLNHVPGRQSVPATAGNAASFALHSPLELTEANAQTAYDSDEINNIGVYKKALPSVVNITSTAIAYDFFYGAVPQQGLGSGFILDKTGRILTNYHVIADARQVEVTLFDKHKYKAQVVLTDKNHDLALLQITAPNLVPAVLADSRGLQVGQKVFAIGNPFGLSGTMTRGIISSIRAVRGPMGNLIEDAIQTDAAINPGNSGGPLLNSRAEVIGINTLIATNPNGGTDQNAGIGFAIPMNSAKAVLNDFAKYGKVQRPTLDIISLPIGPELADQLGLAADYGILIQRAIPGGAADRAGLRGGNQKGYLGNSAINLGGDLIVAIDGEQVTTPQDISQIMDGHRAGDNVTVTIFRGRRQLEIKVTLGQAREGSA